MPRALISVYDKKDIEKLAGVLVFFGWEIIASGGTYKHLKESNIPVIPIEEITGNPEIFDGRMKTLSFQIESGILFDRSNPKHIEEAEKFGIKPIDMVVCNFYPFAETVRSKGLINQAPTDEKQIIEMIDVGGPAMTRAAAKNHKSVVCVTSPDDYADIIKFLQAGGDIPEDFKKELAAKAFSRLVDYDSQIESYLCHTFLHENNKKNGVRVDFFEGWGDKSTKIDSDPIFLRYGENPHQKGYFYNEVNSDPLKLSNFAQHQGKDLSYNNYLDINGALHALCLIGKDEPACVIVKHTNPCGAACSPGIKDAFFKAWNGDSLASFGGIIGVNRRVDEEFARICLSEGRFFEILIAPEFTLEALNIFSSKKNLILLSNKSLEKPFLRENLEIKSVRGGYLVQDADTYEVKKEDLKCVTQKELSSEQMQDMLFAWKICAASKSNCVVIAKDKQLLGSGVGQQDRFRACKIAVEKSGDRATDAVAASDAFFPFPDGPEMLINAGITAIIQPGGSLRDNLTIDLCNEKGVGMAFTGIRGFRH